MKFAPNYVETDWPDPSFPWRLRLQYARKRQQLEQAELGEKMTPAVGQTMISRWERGVGSFPRVDQVWELERALECPTGWLSRSRWFCALLLRLGHGDLLQLAKGGAGWEAATWAGIC
jgi:transcriptional regulator with XRE-family HTH domain